jgi:magnesium-transporting ATPase (P-type)
MFLPQSSTPPARTAKQLLQRLATPLLAGLTQAEAEERARTTGPNDSGTREASKAGSVRVLKMIRNPLVILLSTLSAVSFLTGDPRAGSVMARSWWR